MHPLSIQNRTSTTPTDACKSFIGLHLAHTLSACDTKLVQLSFTGLPIYSFGRYYRKHSFRTTVNPLICVFRSLKTLTLNLDHESLEPDQPLFLDTYKYFPSAIQALNNVDTLSIGFSDCPDSSAEVPDELFKLMLEYQDQHSNHDPMLFTCHRHEECTSNPSNSRHYEIWCPFLEVPGFHTPKNRPLRSAQGLLSLNSSPQLLRILPFSP